MQTAHGTGSSVIFCLRDYDRRRDYEWRRGYDRRRDYERRRGYDSRRGYERRRGYDRKSEFYMQI
jgi:hypothetical protein